MRCRSCESRLSRPVLTGVARVAPSAGDETTRRGPSHEQEAILRPGFALTILAHPSPTRIGDVFVARIGPSSSSSDGTHAVVELSRKSPIFVSANGAEAPLADSFVSRRPISLSLDGDRLTVDVPPETTTLVLDGARLDGTLHLDAERLSPGLVLVLSERIALLVHRRAPLRFPRPDRLGILGESEGIEATRAAIGVTGRLAVPVLIRGESGCGKELVARALVATGPRSRGPFVAINIAALPHALAPSELFGHEQGAFTGAHRAHAGAFARADGGTLFLDEVGDAPPEVQAMLLRALETGEVLAVGANRPRTVDVRVISATDADIEAGGSFKSSLLHRLAGFRIDVPALRERPDDIARLLFAFVSEELGRQGLAAWPGTEEAPWLPAPLVARLVTYGWPGNVRQLRNVARAIAVQAARAEVSLEELERALPGMPAASMRPLASSPSKAARRKASEVPEEELLASLEQHGFRLGAVARALGVSRPALYDRIDKSERVRKAKDLGAHEIRELWEAHDGDPARLAEALRVSPRGLVLRIRELGLADGTPTVG